MRLFNQAVYKATQYGTTATYSASEFNGILGVGEQLALHVRVWPASGTSPKLTLKIETSNDGVAWVYKNTPLNQQSLSTTGPSSFMATDDGSTPSGSMLRLSIELSNADNVADVQVIACGRGEHVQM